MPTPAIQAIIQGAPIRVEMKAPQGPGGKSAYQVAVENGFVGTEAQWLASLAGPNTVTSATTTNFTSGNVLFANSGFVGSLSRSGIDTRTSFPNNDVTNATTTGTPNQLLRLNSAGNTVANIFVALEGIEIGEEGGDAGFIRILNTNGDVVTINNANSSNAEISLPTESGTLALTTDIVDSVTSATTSDGTANLSLSNVSTATATVSSLLTAGHIHGNLAGTLYTHVRTGEAMSKGDPFYISSFHVGTSQPIVMKADASNAAKMPAVGVMDADYAIHTSSANGIISGTLSSINTNGYAVNSPIYVANGGGYSNTAGTIPQQIGITERANVSTGAFIVTNSKVISFADVSDAHTGTAQLSLGDLGVVGGEIYTDGEYSNIYTQGATAHIFTLGSGAEIYTEGELAQIYTTGASAQIYTAGAGATIGTQGANATIYTQGTNATISTAGSAAHIQTSHASAAVKSTNFAAVESGGASLVDGSMQPCLTWSAGGRNLTIPSGTSTTFNTTSYAYGTGAAAAHRTALGLDTLLNAKANLAGGNTFTGAQTITGASLTLQNAGTVTLTLNDTSYANIPTFNLQQIGTTRGRIEGGVGLTSRLDFSVGNPLSRSMSLNQGGTQNYGVTIGRSSIAANVAPPTDGLHVQGSVAIGTTSPNTKAALDITSTTKGFLPPRMTTTERNLIASPPAGLVIYNTTTNNLNSYSGSAWVELVDSADLGTNVANFLTSPTSDNLASALTDENGTGGGFVRAEGATLTGATLSGQTELTSSQTGATQYSVATRSMAEDSLIWASRVRLHASQVSGSISFGGAVGGTVGQFSQLALSNTVNSLARVALATNFLALSYSGSGTNFGIPWQIRIPFGSITTDTNSVFRVWTGSHIANIGVPYNGADGIPMGMSSIGFEFRANPASSNQHQIRLIARDGRSQHSSGYSLTNGSPIISGLSTSAVNSIAAEIAAGRTVYAMSGTLSNVAPDSKGFSDGAVVISATGTTVTLDRNAVTTNASVQMRFVFAAEAGTFAASSWVNVGPIGGLNRQYDTVIENLGNGTANLYCVGWASDIIPPLQTRVPIATLSTGVPTTAKYVTVGSQALEAHLITNGVNAPPTITSNSTAIFNAITKIGI